MILTLAPKGPEFEKVKESGKMVWLQLSDTDFPLRDGEDIWTIGFYQADDSLPEKGFWNYVGWCWSHDHFTNHTTNFADPLNDNKDNTQEPVKILAWANLVWPS